MYCSNCGKLITESAKFCSNCGTLQNLTVINEKRTENENKESIPDKTEIENCKNCDKKKRNIYIGVKFSGNRVCPDCDITPGICPNCGSKLRTNKSQQCGNCKASWRESPPTQEINIVKTDAANKIKCPKCGSNQVAANKKGFSGQKAVVGGLLTGGVGLLAGTIGSNKVKITCLSCGKEFTPGTDMKSLKKKQQQEAEAMNSPTFWLFFAIIMLIFFWLFKGCI